MTGPAFGPPGQNGQGGAYGPPPPMPPGQGTFNSQMPGPGGAATVIQERGWSGFPAAAIPPIPQDPRLNPNQPQGQAPAQGAPAQAYDQWGRPLQAAPPAPPPAQWQPGMGVPTQHAQPGTQPGQQWGPPQGAPSQGIDPNTVLSGPQFPAELQGLTLQQAIGMYGNMRNLAIALQQRAQGQASAAQPPQGPPQGQQPPAQGQPGQPAAFDWRNPAASFEQIIERALERRLAPVEQDSMIQRAGAARNLVAQEVGPQRFAQIEASVLQYLGGADPRALGDPELWRVAVRTAIGDAALRGGPAPAQNGNGQYGPPPDPRYGGAVPFRPGMPNPAPQLNSFFTETPQAGGQAVQGVTLTPQQMWFADQMNVSYADYAAYSQGVPPVNPAQGGRR